MRKIREIDFPV